MTKAKTESIMTTETDFLSQVVDLAHLCGWKVHHSRPAWTAEGYRTPIQGDVGFLDLTLVHEERKLLIFAELKSEKGRLTLAQELWIRALRAAGQIVHIWCPSQWEEIVATLR